jgi:hypothetical protein
MRVRWFTWLAVVFVASAPAAIRAADQDKAGSPTFTIRVKSLDALIADVKYLATLAGKGEEAKQAHGFLEQMTGGKGLPGIDDKRPFGGYIMVSPDITGTSGVGLVPIANEKSFIELLERFNLTTEKGADGIYSVTSELVRVPIFIRFANNYAYVTGLNKGALDKKNLLEPSQALGGKSGLVAATLRLDQIPDALKQMALSQMEVRLTEEQEKTLPGESKAQQKLRGEILKDMSQQIATLINEGANLEIIGDVDRQANALVFEMNLSGQPESKLAACISDLRKKPSLFAGWATGDSALNLLLHMAADEKTRATLGAVIDEGIRKGLSEEKDEGKRAQAEKFVKIIEPTLKSGELDAAVNLHGPSSEKLYSFVFGLKVKDGQKIEEGLENLVKTLPEKDQEKIKLGAESAGDVKIHRIEAQKDFDQHARQIMGDNPVYLAIRSDAVILGGGPEGLERVKAALAAQAKAGAQFSFDVSFKRLAGLMVREHKNALEAADAAFGEQSGKDKLHFTVEGGKTLKVHFDVNTAVMKFLSDLDHPGKDTKPKKKAVEETDK